MNMKQCNTCKENKELSEFWARKKSRDGLYASCRKCVYARQKISTAKPKLTPEQKEKRHQETLERQKTMLGSYASKRRRMFFWEHKGSRMIQTAVLKGEMVRPENCTTCGIKEKLVAHHDDYHFLKQVRWICRSCHRFWHRDNKPIYPEMSKEELGSICDCECHAGSMRERCYCCPMSPTNPNSSVHFVKM